MICNGVNLKTDITIVNCTNPICVKNNVLSVPLNIMNKNNKAHDLTFRWMNTYTCPKCDCVYYTCRIYSIGKRFPAIMIKRQLRKHHNDNHLKMDKIPMVENSSISEK